MNEVHLLTHSYLDGYNRDFTRVFGGGLERYIRDLCGVLRSMGYRPVVHQLSFFENFRTFVDDVEVCGYQYESDDIPEAFERMAAQTDGPIIYASCLWHPIKFRPGSLGICHGINWDRPSLPAATKREVADAIQSAIDRLDRIVSVDSHFQTFARSMCQYENPDQLVLIPNAVDTGHFTPPAGSAGVEAEWRDGAGGRTGEDDGAMTRGAAGRSVAGSWVAPLPLRVLYPRRFGLERGILQMMQIADRLLAEDERIVVEFAGERVPESPVGESFLIWREHHPHRSRIEHRTYGFDEVREAYRSADIAVIPTVYSEGTSYSCLEALSCGVAVVATNVGGLNDLILDGYNGLLVPPTKDALHAAISRLAQDAELRTALGRRARATAFAFDIAIWRRRWTEVLTRFLPPLQVAAEGEADE